jgi:hypothetical protein
LIKKCNILTAAIVRQNRREMHLRQLTPELKFFFKIY